MDRSLSLPDAGAIPKWVEEWKNLPDREKGKRLSKYVTRFYATLGVIFVSAFALALSQIAWILYIFPDHPHQQISVWIPLGINAGELFLGVPALVNLYAMHLKGEL